MREHDGGRRAGQPAGGGEAIDQLDQDRAGWGGRPPGSGPVRAGPGDRGGQRRAGYGISPGPADRHAGRAMAERSRPRTGQIRRRSGRSRPAGPRRGRPGSRSATGRDRPVAGARHRNAPSGRGDLDVQGHLQVPEVSPGGRSRVRSEPVTPAGTVCSTGTRAPRRIPGVAVVQQAQLPGVDRGDRVPARVQCGRRHECAAHIVTVVQIAPDADEADLDRRRLHVISEEVGDGPAQPGTAARVQIVPVGRKPLQPPAYSSGSPADGPGSPADGPGSPADGPGSPADGPGRDSPQRRRSGGDGRRRWRG